MFRVGRSKREVSCPKRSITQKKSQCIGRDRKTLLRIFQGKWLGKRYRKPIRNLGRTSVQSRYLAKRKDHPTSVVMPKLPEVIAATFGGSTIIKGNAKNPLTSLGINTQDGGNRPVRTRHRIANGQVAHATPARRS